MQKGEVWKRPLPDPKEYVDHHDVTQYGEYS